MGWETRFQNNDPSYLEPRISNAESSLAQKASQTDMDNVKKKIAVNFLDYKTGSLTDSQAMNAALSAVSSSAGIVQIPSGTYTMSNIVIPVGVTVQGIGNVTVFSEVDNSYIFQLSRQSLIDNVTLQKTGSHTNVTGITSSGAMRAVARDILVNYCTIGINISVDSYAMVVENFESYQTHNGIICNSAACRISIKLISGDAGYTNTQSNGSIGIQFNDGTNTLIDGGQIDSCQTGIQISAGARTNKIGYIWIESCITSLNIGDNVNLIVDNLYTSVPMILGSNVNFITPFGVNKSIGILKLKDGGFNTSSMFAHYIFNKVDGTKGIVDYSGNKRHITSVLQTYTIQDGAYGKNMTFKGTQTTYRDGMPIPSTGMTYNTNSFVINYINADINNSNNSRVLEFDTATGFNFFIASGGGYLRFYLKDTAISANSVYIQPTSDINEFSNIPLLVSLEVDYVNKKLYITTAHKRQDITSIIPTSYQATFYSNMQASTIKIRPIWSASADLTYNYLYVFNKSVSVSDLMSLNRSNNHIFNTDIMTNYIETLG